MKTTLMKRSRHVRCCSKSHTSTLQFASETSTASWWSTSQGRRSGVWWVSWFPILLGAISWIIHLLAPSLPCPVIWGRRYSWLASFSILPCLLHCPLSTLPVSYLSYTHLSILGLAALLSFSLVCPHLAFFSICAPLTISSYGRTTSVVVL